MSQVPVPLSSDFLWMAVDLSPSGLLVVDAAGTIVFVNREIERLFGYPREELTGRPVEMLVPDRLREGHSRDRARYLEDPRARPMGMGRDLYGRRKDGTEVPVEIGLNPVRAPGGTFTLATVVDISARRRIEHQARQSQKMEAIGTLAGGIAHDFNNILHSIVGHSEMARRAAGDEGQLRADLDQVLAAAERGRRLVRRILTFSRRHEAARVPTRLDRTVREALELLRASLPSTIEMRDALDPRTPAVLADETEIHQVLMNLATNAAHAMGERGTLEVSLAPFQVTEAFARSHPGLRPGPHVRLNVRDTGHGMSPEVVERAFEPFFTTKSPGEGTGLGLSVVLGIVQSQGGAIDLRSRPGEGTSVDLYFPSMGAEVAARSEVRDAPAAGERRHLLFVEDEEALATLQRRQLEAFGYRVTAHTSSLAALEDFRARPDAFDALVTDNTMPKLTGMGLAQEVLRIRPDLPVLMISGLAERVEAADLRGAGIRRVLGKPHTGQELARALEELFAGPME